MLCFPSLIGKRIIITYSLPLFSPYEEVDSGQCPSFFHPITSHPPCSGRNSSASTPLSLLPPAPGTTSCSPTGSWAMRRLSV
ncbi:hypothetical protein P167DRAFT_93895 [Morchella conica CCBAS932]|uniref:Uncharacterized protein n=1 Tax=Morchella conica CCBAS932 TaxID=1392247 RepID=A0A3N4KT74_9PEZI|nr:hypothetical protein P167DRAFT_93895 [Morchella conica CCBAS932]